MRNYWKFLLCCAFGWILQGKLNAQLSGTYNIPTNFTTLASAITALNTQGVSGPVFIELAAGYTETAPAGGYTLTATGTAARPITFRRTGAGLNPLINAYSGGSGTPGSAVQDGVWRLIGSDYITIESIDINDPNTTNPSTMEFGIGFFKASTSDGCQSNTVKNCTINLKTVNNAIGSGPASDGSRGINMVNSLNASQTTVLTPVSAAGTNSGNKFYSNTIRNCNVGISLIGYAAPSPFTLADTGNDIGGSSAATGNTILNFGGATGATNAAAGVRTLAQYDINISYNTLNNNDGTGVNHVSILRGIFVNTAQSANVSVSNNTLTVNAGGAASQVSAIENLAGATAANNTVTISDNLVQNSSNLLNTTSSFYGIYNNGASASYLRISNNRLTGINTRGTTGSNYMIYNTGVVASAIEMDNNQVSSCSNIASTSGAYFTIYNSANSPAALSISGNSFSGNTSTASTGATHIIYNSSPTAGTILMNGNTTNGCTHSISSTGAFYGIYNAGASTSSLEMRSNTFTNQRIDAFSGPSHLFYNTAAAASAITFSNNAVSNCTSAISSSGSYYALYNNAASSSQLIISNNTFSSNVHAVANGSVHVIFNRGAATNTYVSASLDNNVIANYSFSASTGGPFLGIYNGVVTSGNLSLSDNTITANSWTTAMSQKFMVYNTGAVSSVLSLNNNRITSCNVLNNTTGTFNGVVNTGACTVAVNICGNVLSSISNSATTGATNLMLNSGALAGGAITVTNNAVSNVSNTATGTGDFYGISNSGTTFSSAELSNNTYSNNTIASASGVAALVYNTGAVTTSISSINMNNNLLTGNTNSVSTTGSFFGIYNNNSSCAALSMNSNTVAGHSIFANVGANHLIYNRGTATNTFSSIGIGNNLISSCNFSATAGGFYSIWNNGVTSNVTSITSNSIVASNWVTANSLRYMFSNWGVAITSASITGNLISGCTYSGTPTNHLFWIYNNANTAVSSGSLIISNNTFTNNSSAATTGETHYINTSGVITNTFTSIEVSNNLFAACSATILGAGPFFGIYNNSTSANAIVISRNTFTDAVLTASNGPSYFIHNRGIAGNLFPAVTLSNNLISALTHSSIAAGTLYGFANTGVTATNCQLLSLASNTIINSISSGTSGNINLFYNNCPIITSVSFSNNLVSGFANTITATGSFFGINNGGGTSTGDLSVKGNIFRNLVSASSSGPRYMIYNNGGITGSVSVIQNTLTALDHSVSSSGMFYGIFNGGTLPALSVNLSNNTLTNNISSSATGSVNLMLNSGAVTSTLNSVVMDQNVIDSYTFNSTSGSFTGIGNSGYTCLDLSMATNTLNNLSISSTGGNQQLVSNNAKVINSLLLSDNLLTGFTNTVNATGSFFGIVNTANFANSTFPSTATINNNRIRNITLNATTGSIFGINSTGIASNTVGLISISNNSLSALNVTVSSTGNIHGLYNTAISAGSLSISNNTIINVTTTSTVSNRYMAYNGGTVVSSANFSNNLVSGFVTTANTSGSYFGVNNSGLVLGDVAISNNTFLNHTLTASTGTAQFLYNGGVASGSITISSNLVSGVTQTATGSGGFFGVYDNAGGAASLLISANTFTNLSLSSVNGPFYVIHNRNATSGTVAAMSITGNLAGRCDFTSTSGQFCGIFNNGLPFDNLSVNNNTVINTVATTTSSNRFFIYNTGVGTLSASITNNILSSFISSVNTTGSFYGVNNGGTQLGDLSMAGNSLLNVTLAASSGSAFGTYNTAVVSGTVGISNNLMSGLSHSATTSGGFLGWYNNAGASSGLSITSNTITNASLYTSTGATHFIYNRGAASSTITSIHFQNNQVSAITHSATSGPFYAAFNNATSFSSLSVVGNSFSTIASTSSTSPRYFFYNTGAGSAGIMIQSNMVSGYTSSVNTTGTFYDVQNSGACAGDLAVSSNTFNSQVLPFTTGVSYVINNTGLVSGSVSINANLVSGLTHSSTTGAFYNIYINAASCGNLAVTSNSLSTISTTNLVSPKYLIYNSSLSANSISISNNQVNSYLAPLNTTGTFAAIYNTGSAQGSIDILGNQLSTLQVPATTATCYAIYNTGTVAAVNINNNLVSGLTNSVSTSGTFYGIYNPITVSSTLLSMSGNTLSSVAVTVPSLAVYLVYTTGASSLTVNSIAMNNNVISGFTNTLGTGNFYGVFNNGLSSSSLSLSGNTFTNCVSSTTGSVRYMVYNTGSVTGNMSLSGNTIGNCRSALNMTANCYGVYNTGACSGNLDMNTNSIAGNLFESTTGANYLVYNTATIGNIIGMNGNAISANTNSNTSGNFYNVYNSGAANALAMNNNSVTGNVSGGTVSDTYLLYNSGSISNSVSVSANVLSQSYSNTATDYSGTLYHIYNTGGAGTTSLSVSSNTFLGVSFTGAAGTGNVYFINNAHNNARFDLSANVWNGLNMAHSGNEYLMYNPSSTSAELNVLNNSITGYARTANAGSFYGYYGNGSSPASCSQVFSGNVFSAISAGTQGTGSFYGLYSTDGTGSAFPKKQVSNNVINAITYNGLGFFFGYYFDFLGDNSSVGSSVFSNTVSAVNWNGPLYGLYIGGNVSSLAAANVYSNSALNLSSSGTTADVFGAHLLGGGNGLNFYKNRISDLTSSGTLGKANGIYISTAVNTNLYNNLIGNIFTPSTSAANPLNGIQIAGGNRVNSYYNTIKLNATSTGSVFGSSALYAVASVSLDLRNSILINTSAANGIGVTTAFMRNSASLTNYASSSNNNIFYTGIPANNKLIFFDGTNSYPTLTTYQNHVAPRDNASVTEDTPFLSTVGTNSNFLHVDFSIPSLTESGAVNITGITDDVDSQTRQGNPGYAGTGLAPDIGADEYAQSLTPCSGANAGTVTVASTSARCAGEAVYMLSNGATAAGNVVHQWKISTASSSGPFANVSGGNGANTTAYTTSTLSAGVYYFALTTTCTNGPATATSNVVTVTINAVPSASAVAVNTLCSGQDLVLNGSSDIGTSYTWTGPNNFTSSAQNPTVSTAGTNSSGTYTLLVSDANCTSSPVYVNATVYPTPPSFTLAPPVASICIGGSQTITASIPVSNPTLTSGTQANQNSASGAPAPYSLYYGGQKMQILVLASELSAAGFTTGTPIQSIQFPVVSLGANWGSGVFECQNFMVGMKATTSSALSVFETGLSNVVSPGNFTPNVGYNNIHNFSAPFIWDGSSNLVIETAFSNSIIGTSGNAVIQYNSPTGFMSTLVYRADNQSISTIAAATTSNTNVGFVRPDFKLNGAQVGTYSWSPNGNLSGASGASVIASPSASSVYSVELSDGQCVSTTTINIDVILNPTVSISTSASTVCLGNTATLTASGASTYTWSTNSTQTTIVVSPFTSSTYTVTGANPVCPSVSASIVISAAPALTLASSVLPPVLCQGDTATVTISGATTYTWSGGSNATTMTVSPSVTTNYTVNASNGPGCWTTKVVNVKVNPLPVITVTPSGATICAGEVATFEAAGVFNFTWSPGGSNSPIFEAAPVNTTTFTVLGVDLNNCANTTTVEVVVNPCLGIKDQASPGTGIQIFPNPNSGIFTVSFGQTGLKKVSVENAVGAEIYKTDALDASLRMDLSAFAKGIYFVKVEGSQSGVFKVVVE